MIVTLLLAIVPAFAQEPEPEEPKELTPEQKAILQVEFNKNLRLYRTAVRYNDLDVAKMALYQMMLVNPNNVNLADSLAIIYVQQQNYASAVLISQDILAAAPDDLTALEISAIGYENLGLRDKSLEAYEKLYLKNNDLNTLYKITFLQFSLQQYETALTNADIVLANEKAKEFMLSFPISQTEQVQVPMNASILNLKGLIAKAKGDKEGAKGFFNQALEIAPNFPAPKQNIENIDK